VVLKDLTAVREKELEQTEEAFTKNSASLVDAGTR